MNDVRLIDADELRKKAQWMEMPDRQGINFDVRAVSASSIDLSPTIDAVPVVRCKDCRYYYHSVSSFRDGRCAHFGNFDGDPCVDLNAFCSYGERKDGDGNG